MHVLRTSLCKHSHSCVLRHIGCTDTVAFEWVHTLKFTLGVFGAMHLHLHRCHIGGSGCICAAAVSQYTAMGLPTWGCTKLLCIPVTAKIGLARIRSPHVNEALGLGRLHRFHILAIKVEHLADKKKNTLLNVVGRTF